MQNSESNKSLQPRENSASSATKSATNTSRPIINKKGDSVKRRSKTITTKNNQVNGGNLNLQKQISNDNYKSRNEAHNNKENIQPNFQREVSLKELNALSALKRLSDFNEFEDPTYHKLDETFRGINGWNISEDASSNPVSQRILKEKENITNKRGNLMKKDKVQVQSVNNSYPYKNILQNMSNNINAYEKKANQLLNLKESFIEMEKENIFDKERLLLNNGQVGGGFGNIVQDLKKLQEDLQSPEKNRNELDNSMNNGGYVKPMNTILQKQQIEKKGITLKQKGELITSNSQNRYSGSGNGGGGMTNLTPSGQNNTDFKNIQQLLTKVTSNEKSLKMKFNEDYQINISSCNPNSKTIINNNNLANNICNQGGEKSQEERVTACSQQTNNTYLNTSSSTQEIENIQGQLNQPYLRSRIESYSHVVDEISKRKKNHVVRVADTERYDKSFVQYPIQIKNSSTTQHDISNISTSEAAPSQNSNHNEKIQSPILSSYLVKKKSENSQQTESENRRSKSINGVSNNQHHFLSYQNTISNNMNLVSNTSSGNNTSNQTLYGGNLGQQSLVQKISKSISIGKHNPNNFSSSDKDKENSSMQQSKVNVISTPNSTSLISSNKSKDLDVNVRVFPHLSDIQHEKKGLHTRLNVGDNELNPYNITGNANNIFYQPSHVALTPHQFSQSLSRNSYNPKYIAQTNSEKSKNDASWSKSLSQNSHTLITQNSVSLDKKQIPSSTSSGVSTLIIYTNHNHPGSVINTQQSLQNPSQQPIASQNLFNVLSKRIQQGSLSINSTITQQNLQIGNPQIIHQGNGPSRNNSSNKLVLPPKPQSSNLNSTINPQNLQNKNKLPKLFKNSNRAFHKKLNSRNEELKGLQIQAQKAISNSFL